MKKVTIVDYNLGNLYNVERALRFIGAEAAISSDRGVIRDSDYLILPGVGAFGQGMNNLKDNNLIDPISEFAKTGKPILGICLGMQLLMGFGEEFGINKGLGLIPGRAVSFSSLPFFSNNYKVPHYGWESLNFNQNKNIEADIFCADIQEGSYVYFVHSYVVLPDNPESVLASANYGGVSFCSVVHQGNIFGCQFHPEKSGKAGLQFLKNFVRLN